MHLTKTEKKFKENVTRIIKNNKQNIKKAVKIISELDFNDNKVGMKKANKFVICLLKKVLILLENLTTLIMLEKLTIILKK